MGAVLVGLFVELGPAQVKTFLKTVGFRLSNFTLISYNVMWVLTIPD